MSDSDAAKIALAHLLRGPLHSEDQPQVWNTITVQTARLSDHLSVLGLRLHVDDVEGYAYLRADDDLPDGMPRLVRRHSITFGATVLLILLRRHLTTAEADSPRVVVTASEMETWLSDYYSDGISPEKLESDINQVVKLGYLKKLRGSAVDYEIRRVIKAVVTADWINEYGDQLQARAHGKTPGQNEPAPEGAA
jgi:hypothetical protein